jgi:hypothetical protein
MVGPRNPTANPEAGDIPCPLMAEEAGLRLALDHAAGAERRPIAHWVALTVAVTAAVLGVIGVQLSNKVLGGLQGCARSRDADTGGTLLWLTLLILTPIVIIAAGVALVRWHERWLASLVSALAVLLVLGSDSFIIHQAINWSFTCQW